jgi:hypothetical protein
MIAHQETMTTIGSEGADVSETENVIAIETGIETEDTITKATSLGSTKTGKSETVLLGTETWTWISQRSSMTWTYIVPFIVPVAIILCFNGPSLLPHPRVTTSLARLLWTPLP